MNIIITFRVNRTKRYTLLMQMNLARSKGLSILQLNCDQKPLFTSHLEILVET